MAISPFRRVSVQVTLAFLATATAYAGAISNQTFGQLTWYNTDGSVLQANSLWGQFHYSYTPGASTEYLNVVIANGSTSAWVIRNLPLFGSQSGVTGAHNEVLDFDLAEVGLTAGQAWTGGLFSGTVTSAPLANATDPPTIPFGVAVEQRRPADSPGEGPPPADPGRPKPYQDSLPPIVIGPTGDDNGVPAGSRVQEGDSKCAAGAFARSLDWLNGAGKLNLGRTAQQIYDDLIARKVSEPNADGSTARDEWLDRKNRYAREKSGNRIVTKLWDGRDWVDPVPGVREDKGDFLDWLLAERAAGEDVEIVYPTHIVMVTRVWVTENGVFVNYRDDEAQDVPGVGDSEIKRAVKIYKGDDGLYRFGSDALRIQWAVSESVVPEPGTWGLAALAVVWIVRRARARRVTGAAPAPPSRSSP